MNFVFTMVLAAAVCPAGQSVTAETAGQCCWSNQVWSKLQKRCIGVPQCPDGQSAQGETCVIACPAGQSASADTSGHCCWPNQVWANSRNVCVGVPSCPNGMAASGEQCVAQQSAYTPPPQQQAYKPPPPPSQQLQPQSVPDPTADLQARLAELRAEQAKTSVAGGVVALLVGIPAVILGGVFLGLAEETPQVVLSTLLIVVGGVGIIAGLVEIPVAAVTKSRLNRQIRDTEEELRRTQTRSDVLLMPKPQQMLFSVSLPVLTF